MSSKNIKAIKRNKNKNKKKNNAVPGFTAWPGKYSDMILMKSYRYQKLKESMEVKHECKI